MLLVQLCDPPYVRAGCSMPDEHDEVVQMLVAEWVRRAHADMTVATFVDDDRLAPEIIAFHAQQAAEKMLKALLVLRQVDFPRTHSIGALLALCEGAGFFGAQEFTEASSLNAVCRGRPLSERRRTRESPGSEGGGHAGGSGLRMGIHPTSGIGLSDDTSIRWLPNCRMIEEGEANRNVHVGEIGPVSRPCPPRLGL